MGYRIAKDGISHRKTWYIPSAKRGISHETDGISMGSRGVSPLEDGIEEKRAFRRQHSAFKWKSRSWHSAKATATGSIPQGIDGYTLDALGVLGGVYPRVRLGISGYRWVFRFSLESRSYGRRSAAVKSRDEPPSYYAASGCGLRFFVSGGGAGISTVSAAEKAAAAALGSDSAVGQRSAINSGCWR